MGVEVDWRDMKRLVPNWQHLQLLQARWSRTSGTLALKTATFSVYRANPTYFPQCQSSKSLCMV